MKALAFTEWSLSPDPPRHISNPGDVTNSSEQEKIGLVKANTTKFDKSKTMDSMMEPLLGLGLQNEVREAKKIEKWTSH